LKNGHGTAVYRSTPTYETNCLVLGNLPTLREGNSSTTLVDSRIFHADDTKDDCGGVVCRAHAGSISRHSSSHTDWV